MTSVGTIVSFARLRVRFVNLCGMENFDVRVTIRASVFAFLSYGQLGHYHLGFKEVNMYWSWILTAVGLTGFILAGRKVWWCWYINIACQGLWFAYAIVTEQYGFIVASLVYTVVFTQNAIRWTREHREAQV